MAAKKRAPASFRMPKSKCKQVVSKKKGTIVGMKKQGSTILVIACPTGKLTKKTKRCKVATFLREKIKPARGKACPTGYKKAR